MDIDKEFDFMYDYIKEADFVFEDSMEQLRCLWTAFCFHYNIDVDTKRYDDHLICIWDEMEKNETCGLRDLSKFENFMCKYLV